MLGLCRQCPQTKNATGLKSVRQALENAEKNEEHKKWLDEQTGSNLTSQISRRAGMMDENDDDLALCWICLVMRLNYLRRRIMKINYTMTLGALIEVCEVLPAEMPVYFDNGQYPTDIGSWRGSYSDLALNHTNEGEPMCCCDFVAMLKKANGNVFTGYKGGEYKMTDCTNVWVGNYGEYTSMTISGARVSEDRVVLCTIHEDA